MWNYVTSYLSQKIIVSQKGPKMAQDWIFSSLMQKALIDRITFFLDLFDSLGQGKDQALVAQQYPNWTLISFWLCQLKSIVQECMETGLLDRK